MNKAYETIGFPKAFRFLWYSWYSWGIKQSLPPVRTWLLRLAGAKIGRDSVLLDVRFANLYHYGFSRLVIGDRCFVGDEVMFDMRGGITFGNDVTIANRVNVTTHINVGYPGHPLQKKYPMKEAVVTVSDGAYIGAGAIILPGVTIGRESVVGAGAVVTKNVPAHTVVAGVPAKVIKKL